MIRLRLNYHRIHPVFLRPKVAETMNDIVREHCENYQKPEKYQWIVDDLDAMRLKMIIADHPLLARYVETLEVEPFNELWRGVF